MGSVRLQVQLHYPLAAGFAFQFIAGLAGARACIELSPRFKSKEIVGNAVRDPSRRHPGPVNTAASGNTGPVNTASPNTDPVDTAC